MYNRVCNTQRQGFLVGHSFNCKKRRFFTVPECNIPDGKINASVIGTLQIGNGAVFGIFKNAEDIQYLNEQPPIVNSDTSTDAQNDISNIHSCIVDASSFNDNIFFSTVNDVIVKENSGTAKIPELTFGSMDMIVIAQDNYVGWELAEGEQLQIKISIDPYYAHADGTGENMGFGYVYDNKYHELEFQNATEFNFTITADKSGHYYPVLQNIGVSYIHITSGSVSIK